MRAMDGDDLVIIGGFSLIALAVLGAALGAIAYAMIHFPALLPVWPAIGMGFAIGAMDRTSGDVRRVWAWVACGAGVLACLAILAGS